jgi:hypothetical protein
VEGSVAWQGPCSRMRSDTKGTLLLFRHVSLLIGMLDDVRRGVASCKRSECRAERSEWPSVLRASGSCLYISAWYIAEGDGDALNTEDNFLYST